MKNAYYSGLWSKKFECHFTQRLRKKKRTNQKGEKYPLQGTHDKTLKILMIL